MSLSCANSIYGGEWVRVRHIPAESTTWHPATDRLAGTVEYGTESDDSAAWSVNFASKVPAGCSYNEFLFATGDCTKWLVATTDAVIGEEYSNADRPIIASSDGSDYVAKWYNREGNLDPWVSIVDHGDAIAQAKMMYGEGSNTHYITAFNPMAERMFTSEVIAAVNIYMEVDGREFVIFRRRAPPGTQ